MGNSSVASGTRWTVKISRGADQYVIHQSGQELPMYDTRYEPAMDLIYQMDATAGRHTQGTNWFRPEGLEVITPEFLTAGFSADIETLRRAYLNEMDWTHDAAVPKREKLIELGLDDVSEDLW